MQGDQCHWMQEKASKHSSSSTGHPGSQEGKVTADVDVVWPGQETDYHPFGEDSVGRDGCNAVKREKTSGRPWVDGRGPSKEDEKNRQGVEEGQGLVQRPRGGEGTVTVDGAQRPGTQAPQHPAYLRRCESQGNLR